MLTVGFTFWLIVGHERWCSKSKKMSNKTKTHVDCQKWSTQCFLFCFFSFWLLLFKRQIQGLYYVSYKTLTQWVTQRDYPTVHTILSLEKQPNSSGAAPQEHQQHIKMQQCLCECHWSIVKREQIIIKQKEIGSDNFDPFRSQHSSNSYCCMMRITTSTIMTKILQQFEDLCKFCNFLYIFVIYVKCTLKELSIQHHRNSAQVSEDYITTVPEFLYRSSFRVFSGINCPSTIRFGPVPHD